MADDQRRHDPEPPPVAATGPVSAPTGAGPRPGAPDWAALPVPAGVAAHWAAELAATEPGSRDRRAVERLREVALLSAAVPGPALAAWLDAAEPAAFTPAGAVELVAAATRVEAAAHARTARLTAALAALPEMEPRWSTLAGPPPAQRSVAGDELAFRLRLSRIAANRLVREGVAYAGPLQATGEALAAGHVDAPRARVLVDRLGDLPAQVALPVEDLVLPTAGERTVTQLRADVERALLRVDPDGAGERRDRARAERRVTRPRVLPDGMASLSVLLPAADAVRVDGVLDHAARAARTCGDPRTLDQLRADGLRDLVVGVGDPGEGPIWDLQHVVVRDGDRTATATVFRPLTGPLPAPPTDDPAGAEPLPVASAWATPPVAPRAGTPGERPGAQVQVTLAASTALGLDEQPAELEGYGPVDAVTARALAVGGDWRRIVTDPRSGAVLDVGLTRYRPPAPLARHVRIRDRRCAAPGCTVPASRADLDHTEPFHRPRGGHPPDDAGADRPRGTTCAANLGPLCRRHHRLKTDGGFRLRQCSPGVYEWVTPTGHRYRVRPGTDDLVDLTTAPADAVPPF